MANNIEKITQQDESRSEKIACVVSRLPESEQEKIYYMIKGIELAGANKSDLANRMQE